MRYRLYLILVTVFFILQALGGIAQDEFEIGIEPRDKYTQKIIPAIMSIRAIDSETELSGQMQNEQYVIKVKSNTEYQVVVAMQDYKTYRETVKFEKKGNSATAQAYIIIVEPLNPPKSLGPKSYNTGDPVLMIIDKKNRSVIAQSTVSFKTTSGQTVAANKMPQGTWTAKLAEYESYIVEIKAPGYESFRDLVRYKSGEPFEVALNKLDKQPLEFQAVDAATGRPIGARFKLTDNVRETFTGTTTANNDIYGVDVAIQSDPYYLTVTAPGYRSYQITLNIASELPTTQIRQVIRLVKSEATLKLKVIDNQTAQAIASAKLKIIEQGTNKILLDTKDFKGETTLTINPDRKYIVEAETDGYSPYRQIYEARSFNPELNFSVKLTKMLDSYMMLSARDATTDKLLPATFKIISNEQDFEYRTTQISPTGKLTITDPGVYKIETTVPGYGVHKGELNAKEMSFGKVFKYEAIMLSNNAKVVEPVKPKPEPAKPLVVAKTETPKPEPTKPVVVAKTETPKPEPTKPVVVAKTETPKPEPTKPVVVAKTETPKPVVVAAPTSSPFVFRIVDAQTKRPVLPKRFAVRSKKTQQLIPSKFFGGTYSTELQFNDKYTVEIEADGYNQLQSAIDAGIMSKQQIFDKEFLLVATPKTAAPVVAKKTTANTGKGFDNFKLGQTLTFEDNVYFDQGEYMLRPEAQAQLDKLAAIMAANTKLRVDIGGHTDNIGDPRQNMTLSEFRAKVIANHLINKGVLEERITYTGYGQTKPKTTNDTEENKRKNRRVEFIIRDN